MSGTTRRGSEHGQDRTWGMWKEAAMGKGRGRS